MKRIIIILSFVFLFQSLFSVNKADVGTYYKLTNKAEMEVCNNHFKEAFRLYQESFNYLDHPFTHDLYCAFVCSYLLRKPSHTYYQKIRVRGISKEFFTQTKGMDIRVIDSLEQISVIVPTYNKLYRDSLYNMVKRDQLFRISPEKDKLYADTIKKIYSENGEAFFGIIQRRGFPSEGIVGNDSNDLIVPFYDVLIFHQVKGARFQSVNFSSILNDAIIQGKLNNRIGTDLIDLSDGTDRFGTNAAGICYYYWEADYNKDSLARAMLKADHPWYIGEIEPSALMRYNRERPAYYLDNIDDYRKKIIFQMNNAIFDFGLYGYQFTGGLAVKEQYDYLIKNLVEISK